MASFSSAALHCSLTSTHDDGLKPPSRPSPPRHPPPTSFPPPRFKMASTARPPLKSASSSSSSQQQRIRISCRVRPSLPHELERMLAPKEDDEIECSDEGTISCMSKGSRHKFR